jgi:predicted small secreted protein
LSLDSPERTLLGNREVSNLGYSKKVMITRIVLLLFATLTLVLASVGCQTAHGAGEDIENLGQKIQDTLP